MYLQNHRNYLLIIKVQNNGKNGFYINEMSKIMAKAFHRYKMLRNGMFFDR